MSAQMAAPTGAPLDFSHTPRVPFTRLVEVEFRKSYDTRASFWFLVAMFAVVGIVQTFLLIAALVSPGEVYFGDFLGLAAYPIGFVLPLLAIMLVTTEWSQRTAMVTFALEPRRSRVLLAKLVVCLLLTVVTMVFATVLALASTIVLQLFQGDNTEWGFNGLSVPGFVVTTALAMMAGFAIATLLLNTPASIVLFIVYRLVVPGVLIVMGQLIDAFDSVREWIDFQSAQGPIYDWTLSGGDEWGHLIVSGILWLALPLGFGLWRVLRAEVK